MTYVSKDDPPVLLLHGTDDPVVPFAQSEELEKAMTAVGASATLIPARGAGHGYWRQPAHEVVVTTVIIAWLGRTMPAAATTPTTGG